MTQKQCPIYKKCNGCQLQNMDYEAQIAIKQKNVRALLAPFAKVEPIIGMADPTHYRNKSQAVFRSTREHKIVSGIFQSSTGGIAITDSCMLEDPRAGEICAVLRKMLREFSMPPYDEYTGRGFLRSVLIRTGKASGQVLLVLVTASPIFPKKTDFMRVLRERCPCITTAVQSVSTRDGFLSIGERQTVLFGDGFIEDTLCGCRFRISPRSFYQVNPTQTEILYGEAMKLALSEKTGTVIDAYCGVGTLGIIAAANAERVIGVESVRDAVSDARVNAQLNGRKNIRFYNADAGKFMGQLADQRERVDVLLTDPPRAGSSSEFVAAALKLAPKRIVYISCNPETLARDLKLFTASDYAARKIVPVDMFPFTNHVECVVLMSR